MALYKLSRFPPSHSNNRTCLQAEVCSNWGKVTVNKFTLYFFWSNLTADTVSLRGVAVSLIPVCLNISRAAYAHVSITQLFLSLHCKVRGWTGQHSSTFKHRRLHGKKEYLIFIFKATVCNFFQILLSSSSKICRGALRGFCDPDRLDRLTAVQRYFLLKVRKRHCHRWKITSLNQHTSGLQLPSHQRVISCDDWRSG